MLEFISDFQRIQKITNYVAAMGKGLLWYLVRGVLLRSEFQCDLDALSIHLDKRDVPLMLVGGERDIGYKAIQHG